MQARHLPPFPTKTIFMEQTIRIATGGIAEEMRKMEVGEMIRFPFSERTYNSVRNCRCTTLVPDRSEGKEWRIRLNWEEKCTDVTRTA